MASTYSDLKFELIGTGEQSGTWGVTTNTNIGTAIEEAITGSADVTFASGTVTLTLTNTNATQEARNLRLNLIGTSGGAQDLIVPSIEKFYLVNNGCADAITVKNSTGTGVAVPAGKAMLVFNDGTNVVDAVNHFNTASVGTLTLTNALAIAQGGTGATTADTALDNLGGTTTGKAVFKAADAAAGRTALGGGAVGNNVFTAATAAAAQQAMNTEVGVDVQAYDADLTAIGALAKTDGNFIVGNGTTWVAESGATARTSLGLGALATLSSVNAATITDNSVGAAELNVPGNGTAGQYLASDGDGTMTWTTLPAGGFSNIQVFNAPGTWTNPGNVTKVKVTVVGGGGGASTIPLPAAPATQGGAGGAGGTAIEVISIPAATNVPITRGAGGGAQATGGTSSFGTYCSATGGTGATSSNGGLGGTGSGGNINMRGGGAASIGKGAGGSSFFGGGGGINPSNGVAGQAGTLGGGGGAGQKGNATPSSSVTGASGGNGIIIVEY